MAVMFKRPTKQFETELHSIKEANKKQKKDVKVEAAWVRGRGRLTFDQLSEVEAAQFRTELLLDPATGKVTEKRYISLAKMRQALLWAWLCDSRCVSNWADEDEVALDHRPGVLNEYIEASDLAVLGNELMKEFFPEYFGDPDAPEDDTEEELDDDGRGKDGRKRRENPTADSGKPAETN